MLIRRLVLPVAWPMRPVLADPSAPVLQAGAVAYLGRGVGVGLGAGLFTQATTALGPEHGLLASQPQQIAVQRIQPGVALPLGQVELRPQKGLQGGRGNEPGHAQAGGQNLRVGAEVQHVFVVVHSLERLWFFPFSF